MPGVGVDWPDMGRPLDEEEVLPDTQAQARPAEEEQRYRVVLEGLDGLGGTPVAERFNALSALKQGQNDAANVAQLDRRIRQDADLLDSILRASGYYDAQVDSAVDAQDNGTLLVKIIVTPGPLYRFADVEIEGLEKTGIKAPAFGAVLGLDDEDAVDADDVLGGKAALETSLAQTGFPFAKVSEPDIVVDHETRTATLKLDIEPGGERRFGSIRVSGSKPPFGAKHVGTIARFDAGDPFDQQWVDDLRRALIATGVVGNVSVTPEPASDPALADIHVAMEPAPLRTVAGEIGYGTGEGVRAEASWTHRNLIGPEGAFTVRGVLGTREQELGLALRKSNFRARDIVLTSRLGAANSLLPAYEARTVEFAAGLERQSNIIWHKRWTWAGGFELIASDERDMIDTPAAIRSTFLIGSLPLQLGYDRSNDLLDPVRGYRLALRAAPEISLRNGTQTYVRLQLDASAYVPASERVTVAGRIRLGAIQGASTLTLAPSRRFYAGGGSSVRGFGYQKIGPRDAANNPAGGRSLAEFSLEARVRWREFGIVPFVDGGNIASSGLPRLKDFRYGAGIGLRYHSNFGPIRVDVGTPINRQPGDSRVTVFVSLGQAF